MFKGKKKKAKIIVGSLMKGKSINPKKKRKKET
jgi:hypothetical protein